METTNTNFESLHMASQIKQDPFRFEIESDRILSLAELEKAYLSKVTQESPYSKERMAEILGINRKTLYRKQKEYSI